MTYMLQQWRHGKAVVHGFNVCILSNTYMGSVVVDKVNETENTY